MRQVLVELLDHAGRALVPAEYEGPFLDGRRLRFSSPSANNGSSNQTNVPPTRTMVSEANASQPTSAGVPFDIVLSNQ